jgi:hypothetical protein
MKKADVVALSDQEPVGIVISRGSRNEHVPKVAAYEWGPPPEVSKEVLESRVA